MKNSNHNQKKQPAKKSTKMEKGGGEGKGGRERFQRKNFSQWERKETGSSSSGWKQWTQEEWDQYYEEKKKKNASKASEAAVSATAAASPTTETTTDSRNTTEVHLRGYSYRIRVLTDLQAQVLLEDSQFESKLNPEYNTRTWTKKSAANIREAYTNKKLCVYKRSGTDNVFLPLDIEQMTNLYPIAILAPVLLSLFVLSV